jgi:anti-sigma factor RsiW
VTCKTCSIQLDSYLDGELLGHERVQVNQHLEKCAHCREELRVMKVLKQSISEMDMVEPPEGLDERIMAHVMGNVEKREKRTYNFWTAAAAVTAFAAFLGVAAATMKKTENTHAVERAGGMTELTRDQAYVAGTDPLSGGAAAMPIHFNGR